MVAFAGPTSSPPNNHEPQRRGDNDGTRRSDVGADFFGTGLVYDAWIGVFLRGHGSPSQRAEHAHDELLLHLGGAGALDAGGIFVGASSIRERLAWKS